MENANIEVFIGDALVFTDSSGDGSYLAEIELDDHESEELVKVFATSQDDNKIKFASILGPVSSLLEYAGDDGVLDSSDNHSVNISSVSTAIAAIFEAEANKSIESSEDWHSSLKLVDADRAFSVATAIKVFIDYADRGISIPSEVEDTYQFASDFKLSSEYVYLLEVTMNELYREAQEELAQADGLLSLSSGTQASIADIYDLGWGEIKLNEDGTGEYLSDGVAVELSWQESSEGIVLEVDSTFTVSDSTYIDGSYVYFERNRELKKLFWAYDSESQGMLVFEVSDSLRYPGGQLPDSVEKGYWAVSAVRSKGLVNPRDALVLGEVYSMPMPSRAGEVVGATEDYYPDFTTPDFTTNTMEMSFSGDFDEGGVVSVKVPSTSLDGKALETDITATWMLNNSNRLIVNLPDNSQLTYSLLNVVADGVFETSVSERLDDGSYSFWLSNVLLKGNESWSERDVAGIYTYQPTFANPLYSYSFDLSVDGSLVIVNSFDLNKNNEIEDNEYYESPGRWQVGDNGSLFIRRYRSEDGSYCLPSSWEPSDDEGCEVSREREWELHQFVEPNNYWFRQHRNIFRDANELSLPVGTDIGGYILNYGNIYNTHLQKVDERPVVMSE
ncbi:hypothetical protein ACJJIF_14235 [Microbulbifer sp. SSSA002]|uniref:hypothetical protein n=1 Tax=Microbulbifer sp. SSSA002 TaxID=3243376 RepID=UPI00403A6876